MVRDEGFLYPREDRVRLDDKHRAILWDMISERDNYECVYCRQVLGKKSRGYHHHHIKTRGQQGGDTADNIVLLCVEHHNGNEKESAHGLYGKQVRAVLEEYIQSDYVQQWLRRHSEELEELYTHRYVQPHNRKRRKKPK